MTEIKFVKETVQEFARCLDKQEAIQPPGGAWTSDNMMMLAGACQCVVLSQGFRWQEAQGIVVENLPEEQRAAAEAAFVPENNAVIEWISSKCFLVMDGEYDEDFEAEHVALIVVDPDGKKTISPVKGFKNFESRPEIHDEGGPSQN